MNIEKTVKFPFREESIGKRGLHVNKELALMVVRETG